MENKEIISEETELVAMEEQTEVSEFPDIQEVLGQGTKLFSTFDIEKLTNDPETQLKVLNALAASDKQIERCIDQEIELVDLISYYTVRKDGTNQPVFILFDKNDVTYSTGSVGIFNQFKLVAPILARMDLHKKPYKIKIVKEKGNNGHDFTKFVPVK